MKNRPFHYSTSVETLLEQGGLRVNPNHYQPGKCVQRRWFKPKKAVLSFSVGKPGVMSTLRWRPADEKEAIVYYNLCKKDGIPLPSGLLALGKIGKYRSKWSNGHVEKFRCVVLITDDGQILNIRTASIYNDHADGNWQDLWVIEGKI